MQTETNIDDRPANIKHSEKPPRGWWAPGGYFCRCHSCLSNFAGDKRAGTCADCAYADLDLYESAKAALEFYNNCSVEDYSNGDDESIKKELRRAVLCYSALLEREKAQRKDRVTLDDVDDFLGTNNLTNLKPLNLK